MPKNKNENEKGIEPEAAEGNVVTPAEPRSNANTVLLVIIIVLLSLIVIAGICFAGWYFWKMKQEQKMRQLETQIQSQSQLGNPVKNENAAPNTASEQGLVYENNDFGFRLNFTPSWENYRAESNAMGGDFEVSRTCFFLPTKYANYTGELPEYTSPFCISAFVAYSWDEEEKRNSAGLGPMGEVVGRNSKYVFVYSHFNGDMPPDVPQQAILDMPIIAEGIETFEPCQNSSSNVSPQNANLGSSIENPITGSRPVVSPDFQMSGVYYWNCKHRYTLTYPADWANNGMTSDSNVVILKGNKVQLWIEAVPITVTENLQSFAKKRAAKISGDLALVRSVDWNGEATILQATFRNPDSIALWWQAGDYGMELKAFGPGYNNEYMNIHDTISTLDPNINVYQCNSASLSKTWVKTTANINVNKGCTYPNGDVVDWWCQVSEKERDCYEEKYGDPAGVSDKDCVKTTDSKDRECNYPKGDVEDWWEDASEFAKDCFIDDGGIPPED